MMGEYELPPVPLTPADVDLMAFPDVLIQELRRLKQFFERFGIRWYIQSSLAAAIYGKRQRNVTDIDVRAQYDISRLYGMVREHLSPSAQLRGPVNYKFGEFRNDCIIVDINFPATHIDITTEINTYRRAAEVVLQVPFDRSPRNMRVHRDYSDEFPVCSLEYLVIYKLANSRDSAERKNDLGEAAVLLKELATKWALP